MARGEGLDKGKRDAVVAQARAMLRRRPPIQIVRREIAEAAGVAPGLVTYHFAEDASLVEAAAKPIIDGYLLRLQEITAADGGLPVMLRRIILLFLEIARDDGQLLDSYIAYVKQNELRPSPDFLVESYKALQRFFALCEQEQHIRSENFAFIETAVWGICKTVAQTPELVRFMHDAPVTAEEIIEKQADLILTLIGHGLTNSPGAASDMWGVFSGQRR